jgi:methyl-accepting chemotaxis protein
MLSRLRIGPKLWLAPGIVLVVLSLLSAGTYRAMVRQNAALGMGIRQSADQARAADELAATASRVHAQAYQVMARLAGGQPMRRVQPLIADVRKGLETVGRGIAELPRPAPSANGSPAPDPVRAAWGAYSGAVKDAIDAGNDDGSDGAGAMARADASLAAVIQRLGDVARRARLQSARTVEDAADEVRVFALLMPLAIVLAAAAALTLTLALRRGLLADAGAIDAAVAALVDGDFTARSHAYGGDEIGAAGRRLDAGVQALNGTMRDVLDAARSIGASSREIVLGRAAMPARAGMREAAECAAGPIRATIDGIADGARRARAASGAAEAMANTAQEGAEAVHRIMATLDTVRAAALRLEMIGATVEAASARANAAGGARPAGERDPAHHDAPALDDTTRQTLRATTAVAREVRALARQAAAAADGGATWAVLAGARLAELEGALRDMGDAVAHVADAGAAHARELNDIDQVIARMDAVGRQESRLVEDAAMAARSLQAQARALSRTVASFRLEEIVPGRARWHEKTPPGMSDGQPGGIARSYLRLVDGPR